MKFLPVLSVSVCVIFLSACSSGSKVKQNEANPATNTQAQASNAYLTSLRLANAYPNAGANPNTYPSVNANPNAYPNPYPANIKSIGLRSDVDFARQNFDPTKEAFDILQYVVTVAKKKKDDWMKRPSSIPNSGLTKPTRGEYYSSSVTLSKKEFETTESFEARTAKANKLREARITHLDLEYQKNMSRYTDVMAEYSLNLAKEKEQRLSMVDDMYAKFLKDGIKNILGEPSLKDLIYDADKQQFFAMLYSRKTEFKKRVAISVPMFLAKEFKENSLYAAPDIEFTLNDKGDSLYISKIETLYKGSVFATEVVDEADIAVNK